MSGEDGERPELDLGPQPGPVVGGMFRTWWAVLRLLVLAAMFYMSLAFLFCSNDTTVHVVIDDRRQHGEIQ